MLMMSISYQTRDARAATGGCDMSEQRTVADRDYRLGQLERERSEARAEPGGQNQRARHRPQYA